MSDEAKVREKTRWVLPKWGWALLFGSLALNLLVVGSIIGHQFSKHPRGGPGGGMRGLVSSLPDGQRERVREILGKHREDIRPLRQEVRKARRDLADYVQSDKMDVTEFKRRLGELDSKRDAVRQRLTPMMVELAGTLDAETRGRVLKRLLRVDRRRGRKRRHRH